MNPTHLSLNRFLVAHYADGSARPLSQIPEDERNALLAEIVKRFNEYDAPVALTLEEPAYAEA